MTEPTRLQKKDALNLPEKIFSTVTVQPTHEEARIYTDLSDELMTVLATGEELSYKTRLTLFSKFRQITGGWIEDHQIDPLPSKLKAVLEAVGDTQEQIIVWCNYTRELEMVADALEKIGPVSRYYGRIPQGERRDAEKTKFQKGETRFFVANPQAGKFSLNLQNCMVQFFYDLPTQILAYLQAQDRSHRIGVKGTCFYKNFVMDGTVDQRMLRILTDNEDVIRTFQSFDINSFASMLVSEKNRKNIVLAA